MTTPRSCTHIVGERVETEEMNNGKPRTSDEGYFFDTSIFSHLHTAEELAFKESKFQVSTSLPSLCGDIEMGRILLAGVFRGANTGGLIQVRIEGGIPDPGPEGGPRRPLAYLFHRNHHAGRTSGHSNDVSIRFQRHSDVL